MKKISLSKYFKSLAKIHAALILVQLIFVVAVLFIRAEGYINTGSEKFTYFSYLLPVLVFAGLFAGNRTFKQKVKVASGKSTLGKKLTLYRKGIFLRYIFWLVSSLASLAAWLLTGNWPYIALAGLVVIVFFANWPTVDRAKRELDF
jgi:hypothetical protein